MDLTLKEVPDPDYFDSNGPWKDISAICTRVVSEPQWLSNGPGKWKQGQFLTMFLHSGMWCLHWLEITGAQVPEGIDGISFLPELLGKNQKKHEYLYWEFLLHEQGGKMAVRMGNWKAVETECGQSAPGRCRIIWSCGLIRAKQLIWQQRIRKL